MRTSQRDWKTSKSESGNFQWDGDTYIISLQNEMWRKEGTRKIVKTYMWCLHAFMPGLAWQCHHVSSVSMWVSVSRWTGTTLVSITESIKRLDIWDIKVTLWKTERPRLKKRTKNIYSSYFKLSNILFMLNTSFHLIITVKTKTVYPPLNNFKSQ